MTVTDIYASPVRIRPHQEVAGSSRTAVPVVVYGNRWCGLTQMVARTLRRAGVDYDYVDLDEQPWVERRLQALSRGRLRTPVVYVDGRWLVAPSPVQLRTALARAGAAA